MPYRQGKASVWRAAISDQDRLTHARDAGDRTKLAPRDGGTALRERIAAFLASVYPRESRCRLVALDFDVREEAARLWLQRQAPSVFYVEDMAARWGAPFLTALFSHRPGPDGEEEEIIRITIAAGAIAPVPDIPAVAQPSHRPWLLALARKLTEDQGDAVLGGGDPAPLPLAERGWQLAQRLLSR